MIVIFIQIDMTNEVPIYEQIKQRIIEGIARSEIVSGESLPSVRALAADLGVNMHTISKAYAQLKEKGFLSIHRNLGAVVNPPSEYAADEEYIEALILQMRPFAIEAVCKGIKAGEWLSVCNDAYEGLQKKRSL